MAAAAALLAATAACYDPVDPGFGTYESCGTGLISVPTRTSSWIEPTPHVLVAGQVHHTSCDEPVQSIAVTVSNAATGFAETQTAESECVQVFPTTGATQRKYTYNEYVPLAPGQNVVQVRALSKCGSLDVTCDPCVDPQPVPDAAPPPPPDAGPPCQLAVTDPADLESTASENPITVSGTLGAGGESMMWANSTNGAVGGINYDPGDPTWSTLVSLGLDERNTITVYAWCADGLSDTAVFYVTHVPP